MKYLAFFDEVEPIILKDELASFLGNFKDGLVEFRFLDIVKSAGHSCPTVAGAYLMAREGLNDLYRGEIPKRGEVIVEFAEDIKDGVAGVIGNVFSQITGATVVSGFKGLGGRFVRHSLMKFNQDIPSDVRLTRVDTNKSVDVFYDPSIIPADPRMERLMNSMSTDDEKYRFQELWQTRVEKILKNYQKVIEVKQL